MSELQQPHDQEPNNSKDKPHLEEKSIGMNVNSLVANVVLRLPIPVTSNERKQAQDLLDKHGLDVGEIAASENIPKERVPEFVVKSAKAQRVSVEELIVDEKLRLGRLTHAASPTILEKIVSEDLRVAANMLQLVDTGGKVVQQTHKAYEVRAKKGASPKAIQEKYEELKASEDCLVTFRNNYNSQLRSILKKVAKAEQIQDKSSFLSGQIDALLAGGEFSSDLLERLRKDIV